MIKFIAEIGMNADGNFDRNYELIKQAKQSGADIAKFQLGWRDSKNDINYIDLRRLKQLISWCNQFEIEFLASIINRNAFNLVKKVNVNSYKIASRTFKDDIDLCNDIIKTKKNTYASLGMWTKKSFPFIKKNVKYLFCVSKYPTYYKDLKAFPKNFNKFYGYSDHLIGNEGCILAASRGAKIIEKHFTLGKSSNVIRDHLLSATPDEFRELVNNCKAVYKLNQSIS